MTISSNQIHVFHTWSRHICVIYVWHIFQLSQKERIIYANVRKMRVKILSSLTNIFRENHLWYPSKETMGVESWPCFLLRSYFCGTWSVYSCLVTKDHPSQSARTLQTQQKLPMNLSPRDGGTDPRRKYTPNTIHPLSDINVHPQ